MDCHGQRVVIPAARGVDADHLLLGVRPEKVHLLPAATAVQPGLNVLGGGEVVDASYTGVSTQYLVRMPWQDTLTVFVQNLGVGERFVPGDRVQLCWEPAHTFGLAGDPVAGVEKDAAELTAAGKR